MMKRWTVGEGGKVGEMRQTVGEGRTVEEGRCEKRTIE